MSYRGYRPIFSGVSKPRRADPRTSSVTVVKPPIKVRVRGSDPAMRTTGLFDRFQLGNKALGSLLELASLGPCYEELKRQMRFPSEKRLERVSRLRHAVHAICEVM